MAEILILSKWSGCSGTTGGLFAIEGSSPFLGLGMETYTQSLREVTHIIFIPRQEVMKLSVDEYRPQLILLRQLIDFSSSSSHGSSLLFITSLGTISSGSCTRNSSGRVRLPEQVLADWSVVEDLDYSQSKAICERVLEAAASANPNVPYLICRVGQIVPSTTSTDRNQLDGSRSSFRLANLSINCLHPLEARIKSTGCLSILRRARSSSF